MLISIIAFALTVGAAACLYLGTANQRWRRKPWPAAAALAGSALALLAAGIGWSRQLHPATAACVVLGVFMVALITLPVLTALLRRPAGQVR